MRIRNVLMTSIAATAAALAFGATAASAAVSVDPATGNGFIGKGDVQLAYGWNNATLQNNAAGVDFQQVTTTVVDATCEFYTESTNVWFEGTGKDKIKHTETVRLTHTAVKDFDTTASRDLATVSRKNPNGDVNGFKVTGGLVTPSGDVIPAIGDACLGNGNGTIDPHISDVQIVSTTNVLNVTYNGNVKQIFDFNAPVVAPVV